MPPGIPMQAALLQPAVPATHQARLLVSTVAIAMVDFAAGDIGFFNYEVAFPVDFHENLLMLPGLDRCSDNESKKIKKGLKKDENAKPKKTTRKRPTRTTYKKLAKKICELHNDA